jgi:hypothetical protein
MSLSLGRGARIVIVAPDNIDITALHYRTKYSHIDAGLIALDNGANVY